MPLCADWPKAASLPVSGPTSPNLMGSAAEGHGLAKLRLDPSEENRRVRAILAFLADTGAPGL